MINTEVNIALLWYLLKKVRQALIVLRFSGPKLQKNLANLRKKSCESPPRQIRNLTSLYVLPVFYITPWESSNWNRKKYIQKKTSWPPISRLYFWGSNQPVSLIQCFSTVELRVPSKCVVKFFWFWLTLKFVLEITRFCSVLGVFRCF